MYQPPKRPYSHPRPQSHFKKFRLPHIAKRCAGNEVAIFILFESVGVLFERAFSLWVSLMWKILDFQQASNTIQRQMKFRSKPPELFLGKGVLKICSKFTGEYPCRSVISVKLLCNVLISYPLKTSENLWLSGRFSGVFRGYIMEHCLKMG